MRANIFMIELFGALLLCYCCCMTNAQETTDASSTTYTLPTFYADLFKLYREKFIDFKGIVVDATHGVEKPFINNNCECDVVGEYLLGSTAIATTPTMEIRIEKSGLTYYSKPILPKSTHIEMASHIDPKRRTVANLQVHELISPLVMIDISDRCMLNPDCSVTLNDIFAWENVYGKIPKGALVIMKSGWYKRFGDDTAYHNANPNSPHIYHFPGFNENVALFLAKRRNVHGIGSDSPSVDMGATKTYGVHYTMLDRYDKYNVENLNLANPRIPLSGAHIVIVPNYLESIPEMPIRAFVLIPDELV
jgi:kynurenine formamidase